MGLGAETNDHAPLRRVVAESWRRSRRFALDPDAVPGVVDVAEDELRAYRDEHPLVAARPIIDRLLVQHATDAGLIVAITAAGCGRREARRAGRCAHHRDRAGAPRRPGPHEAGLVGKRGSAQALAGVAA